jgi:hypothetical protein
MHVHSCILLSFVSVFHIIKDLVTPFAQTAVFRSIKAVTSDMTGTSTPYIPYSLKHLDVQGGKGASA